MLFVSEKFIVEKQNALCNDGATIKTSDECKKAAKVFNKAVDFGMDEDFWFLFMDEQKKSDFPKGCYYIKENNINQVFFNSDESDPNFTGQNSNDAYPICRGNMVT